MLNTAPPRPGRSVEVAVVGAGVVGLSIAWHLAELGIEQVTVFERSGIGAGASGIQPGGVRQQWSTRVNCGMALESISFYRDVTARLEARSQPVLEQCGYAFLAESEESLARLSAGVAVQNELGIPSRIVTRTEVEELVPGLSATTVTGAAWCGEDGYFDKPQGVVEAFAEAAVRSGVEVRIAEVRAIAPDGGGWILRLSDGSVERAGQVVVAAGCDSPSIVESLGLALPIEKQSRYLFLSEPIRERLLEPLVVAPDRRFAAKQLADGRVLASDLGAEGDQEAGRGAWRRTVHEGVNALLPGLQFVSYPLLVEGAYDITPDHQPILGAVGGIEGLWLAAGFSGHGFMMAPAIGRRLAAAVVGAAPLHSSLDELSLARFESSELVRELQIV